MALNKKRVYIMTFFGVFALMTQGCGFHTTKVVTSGGIVGVELVANEPIYYREGCADCGFTQREKDIDRRLGCGRLPQTLNIYKTAYSIDSRSTFNIVEVIEIGYVGVSLGKWNDSRLAVLEDNLGRLSIRAIEDLFVENKSVCKPNRL